MAFLRSKMIPNGKGGVNGPYWYLVEHTTNAKGKDKQKQTYIGLDKGKADAALLQANGPPDEPYSPQVRFEADKVGTTIWTPNRKPAVYVETYRCIPIYAEPGGPDPHQDIAAVKELLALSTEGQDFSLKGVVILHTWDMRVHERTGQVVGANGVYCEGSKVLYLYSGLASHTLDVEQNMGIFSHELGHDTHRRMVESEMYRPGSTPLRRWNDACQVEGPISDYASDWQQRGGEQWKNENFAEASAVFSGVDDDRANCEDAKARYPQTYAAWLEVRKWDSRWL